MDKKEKQGIAYKKWYEGNVWVISFKANRMKNTATLDELIVFANNVNKLMLK